jgi:6-pyruvoyltetrahydropterin/6-carboxytetrahydropterin synthase
MVLDFGQIKEAVGSVLDHFDHALILDIGDPVLKALEGFGFKTATMDGPPTAEAMSIFFSREISKLMQSNITLCEVRVWETPTSFAEYEGEGVSPCLNCDCQ